MSYSISEVSKKFNLSIHTLRYYEKEGILNIKRSESGIRKYEQSDIDSLKIIECLKHSGMSLKDIKQFMDWCNLGDSTLELRQAMFARQRASVLKQMKDLQETLDVINFKYWYYETANKLGSEKAVKEIKPCNMPESILKIYKELYDDNIENSNNLCSCTKGAESK